MRTKKGIKKVIYGTLLLMMGTMTTSCSTNSTGNPGTFFKVNTLLQSPESQGINSNKILEGLEYFDKNDQDWRSLVILRNGQLIVDAHKYPNNPQSLVDIRSATKSVTALLIGLAIKNGFIKDVKQSVVDIFKDRVIANLDENKKRLTIENLLTMSTGFNWDETVLKKDGNSEILSEYSYDVIQHVLDTPVDEQPGTSYKYVTGASNLLAGIIEKSTNMSYVDFANMYLFQPLQIQNQKYRLDKMGRAFGGFGLYLTTMDMAKIGQLVLNKGIWEGEELISSTYVDKMLTSFYDSQGYGYGWYIYEQGYYSAEGGYGNFIILMPNYNLVVAFNGSFKNAEEQFQNLVGFVVSSVDSEASVLRDTKSQNGLENYLTSKIPESQEVPFIDPSIFTKYEFRVNSLGLKTVQFSRKENVMTINITTIDKEFIVPVGLDGVYQQSEISLHDERYFMGTDSSIIFSKTKIINSKELLIEINSMDRNTKLFIKGKFDNRDLHMEYYNEKNPHEKLEFSGFIIN